MDRIDVLGELRLWERGVPRPFSGSDTSRLVLGYLVLRAGWDVDLGTLTERVLGLGRRQAPRVARVVQDLADVLGGESGQSGRSGEDGKGGGSAVSLRVSVDGTSFRLRVPERGTDLLDSRHLHGEALGFDTGSAAARERFAAALRLWRGPFLGGIDVSGWAEVHSLREERSRLVEDDVLDRLRGEPPGGGDALDDLRGLVRDDPCREVLASVLVDVLVHRGRTAEARDVWLASTGALAERWGLDPGVGLRRRQRWIGLDSTGPGSGSGPTDVSLLSVSRTADSPGFDAVIQEVVARHRGTVIWRVELVAMIVFVGGERALRALRTARELAGAAGRADPGGVRATIVSGRADGYTPENARTGGGPILWGDLLAEGREFYFDAPFGRITVDAATRDATCDHADHVLVDGRWGEPITPAGEEERADRTLSRR